MNNLIKDNYHTIVNNGPGALKYIEHQDQKSCILAVRMNPEVLKDVKNKEEIICYEAVRLDGLTIRFVEEKDQTEKVCKAAIYQNPKSLQFIFNQTEELCNYAVELYTEAVYYIKDANIRNKIIQNLDAHNISLSFMTQDELNNYPLLLIAIEANPEQLKCIDGKKQSDEICRMAVSRDPSTIRYVENQTKELCTLAIEYDPLSLQYVRDQDEELCLIAINKNAHAIQYVKNKTDKICKVALDKNPIVLKYIDDSYQSKEFCQDLFYNEYSKKTGKDIFKHIKDEYKTYDMCWKAIDINIRNVYYIPSYIFDKKMVDKIINDILDRCCYYNVDRVIRSIPCNLISFEMYKQLIQKDIKLFKHIPEYHFATNDHELENLCIEILEADKDNNYYSNYLADGCRHNEYVYKSISIFQKSEYVVLHMLNYGYKYIKYIDKEYQTKSICKKALECNINSIKYIHNLDSDMCNYVLNSKDFSDSLLITLKNKLLPEDIYYKLLVKGLITMNDIKKCNKSDKILIYYFNSILKDLDESRQKNIIQNLLGYNGDKETHE